MGKKNQKANPRKPRLRSRVRLLLTDTEIKELDRAVAESGAWSRSLVVAEAIQAGLSNFDSRLAQERRSRRVDVRLPTRLIDNLKRLATTHTLTQQNLLRHFLFRYLATGPWMSNEATRTENESRAKDVLL